MSTAYQANVPIVAIDGDLPPQTPTTNGRALISNGSTASWQTVTAMIGNNPGQVTPTAMATVILPTQTGNTGKTLVTNGTTAEWVTSPVGYTGSAGANGYTGSAGANGAQGPIGYTGSQGANGAQGPIGYTGSAGVASVSSESVGSYIICMHTQGPYPYLDTVYTNIGVGVGIFGNPSVRLGYIMRDYPSQSYPGATVTNTISGTWVNRGIISSTQVDAMTTYMLLLQRVA